MSAKVKIINNLFGNGPNLFIFLPFGSLSGYFSFSEEIITSALTARENLHHITSHKNGQLWKFLDRVERMIFWTRPFRDPKWITFTLRFEVSVK